MAPHRWTSEAQLELLESKTGSYIHHRNAHTLPRFRADLFREWFDQFPERGDLGPDVQGPLTQLEAAALPAAIWKQKERINNWFRNHHGQKGRRAVTGRVSLSILRPKGRRALQPVEVYSRKYYDERVKPHVDAAIEAGAVTDPSAKLNLVKCITREAYEADSDEVKAEIKEEVEALKSFCELLKGGVDPESAEIDDVQPDARAEREATEHSSSPPAEGSSSNDAEMTLCDANSSETTPSIDIQIGQLSLSQDSDSTLPTSGSPSGGVESGVLEESSTSSSEPETVQNTPLIEDAVMSDPGSLASHESPAPDSCGSSAILPQPSPVSPALPNSESASPPPIQRTTPVTAASSFTSITSAVPDHVISSAGGNVAVNTSDTSLSIEDKSMLDLLFGDSSGEYGVSEFDQLNLQSYAPAPQSYDNVSPMFPWGNSFAAPAPIAFTSQQMAQALSYPAQIQGVPWSNAGISAPHDLMFHMSSSGYPPIAPMPSAAAVMHSGYPQPGSAWSGNPAIVQSFTSASGLPSYNASTFVFPTSPGPQNAVPPTTRAPVTPPAAIDAPQGNLPPEAAITGGTGSIRVDAPLGMETLPDMTAAQGRPQRVRRVPKNPDGTQPMLPGTRDMEKEGTDIATEDSPKRKRGSTSNTTVVRKKGRL
ncbi:hypothetical protein FOMPIDRAFT_1018394 [Fomitopsis schrenkii]|uniref:Uncharacterized protein n=1 Tax=Fomitopsis schrenkii TaxID=2126942 RepID=S8E175_FOMSC|nr:hypothetical protein FOMPIDRAFT_1018394 [Fomitopsis schrenkii]